MADAYTRALDKSLSGLLGLYEDWKRQPQMAAIGGLLSGDTQPMKEWLGPRKPWPTMAQIKANSKNMTDEQKRAAAQEAINLALDLNNPIQAPLMAGMFIGKNSKVWDALKADEAQKMLAKGADPKEVWKKTGTFKGVDGALRQEIDDSAAKFSAAATKPDDRYMEVGIGSLGDAMNHPRLSNAYPTLNSMTLELNPNIRQQGTYSDGILQVKRSSEPIRKSDLNAWRTSLLNTPESEMIDDAKYLVETEGLSFDDALRITKETRDEEVARVTKDLSNADFTNSERSTTLHELQHAIQEREGWARGGSPDQFKVPPEMMQGMHSYDDMQRAIKLLESAKARGVPVSSLSPRWITEGARDIAGRYEKMPNGLEILAKNANERGLIDDPIDAYKRLAGEAEARLTQSRMNMTMPERLQVYPYDMLDVPQDQLIVRGLLGK